MKKQLLLLALALSTTTQIMSEQKNTKAGQRLVDFITKNGVNTLSQEDQAKFTKKIEKIKQHHPKQLNGYYPYGGIQMMPLMIAAYYVNPEMVNLLVTNGADASLESQGELQAPAINFISLQIPGEQDPLKTQLYNLKNPSSMVYTQNGNQTQVTTTADFANSRLTRTTALLINTGS